MSVCVNPTFLKVKYRNVKYKCIHLAGPVEGNEHLKKKDKKGNFNTIVNSLKLTIIVPKYEIHE